MNRITAACIAALATSVPVVALAGPAAADDMSHEDSRTLHATLDPIKVNKVTGSGTATVVLDGNQAHVTIHTSGLLKDAPHAQHFHIGAKGICPPDSAAKKHNGLLSLTTTDGQPFYGMIGTSLTTTGDTSPASGLAVDRFPKGSSFQYERTITLSAEAAESVREGNAVVVVHGIDYNGNGKYDDVLGASDLDPKLPAEATDPALCGPLKMAAKGAVHAGEGGTQAGGLDYATATAAGGSAMLIAAAGAYTLRRRSRKN
ncbi:hypothetical protein ACGFZZ_16105 [Streptomyces tendae]|uniref:hypothetical protein n=1 Tax=Streptomyces tendae TaxID=1932 RepID=UPI0033C1633B